MIETKIKMNQDKLNEFIRLLVPESINDKVTINLIDEKDNFTIITTNSENKVEMSYKKIGLDYFDQEEVMAKSSLLKLYSKNFEWGSLIGVRPTKIVRRFLNMGLDYNEIESILKNIYLVSNKKVKLLIEIVQREMKYLDTNTIGVYIGVAYCPTKCTYCSFPAYLKKGKYLERYDEYIDTLIKEIEMMGQFIKKQDLIVNTIYIGGGTPSILSLDEMERLFEVIQINFNLSSLDEFTFEAGRVDTLNKEKIDLLKKYGVERISLNTQSFKEETLKLVNRYYNISEFNYIFSYAKNNGLLINMDLIIGLPKESTEDIIKTLEITKFYDVDNLTIHNLSIKNASKLKEEMYEHNNKLNYEKIYNKIDEVIKFLNLNPYYMYRQKNSFSWGENIGFSKEGIESIYNIEMIEENKTIIGIGAGGMTKIIDGLHIDRIVNPKDPLVWMNEFEERIKLKIDKLEEFYG